MKTGDKAAFLEMSFNWMFALIVGAAILFFAIFFIIKFIGTQSTASDTAASVSLGVLTNPLETSVGESKVNLLSMPTKSVIHAGCNDIGDFGEQTVRINQENLGKSSESYFDASFENKYFFAEKDINGKEFYLFSKPFEFPFKVADIIYIIPKDEIYCFISAPKEINNEINNLGLKNIANTTNTDLCPKGSIKVCFSGTCDVKVDYNLGYLTKGRDRFYFEGMDDGRALMYAAIFSNKDLYECNVKRLLKRVSALIEIYDGEMSTLSINNCNSNINFGDFLSGIRGYKDSSDLTPLMLTAKQIKNQNEVSACRLW